MTRSSCWREPNVFFAAEPYRAQADIAEDTHFQWPGVNAAVTPDRDPIAFSHDWHPSDGLKARDKDLSEIVRGLTGGRGPEASINAVGMEAHGSSIGKLTHQLTSLLPNGLAEKLSPHALPVSITGATCGSLCGRGKRLRKCKDYKKGRGRGFALTGRW